MKQLLLFFIATIFYPFTSIAQLPWDDETNKITYNGIVEVIDATKKQLYTRAKLWMVTNLASHDSHLNYYNEEAGTIIANGHFSANYILAVPFWERLDRCTFEIKYTINVSVKESKYRYIITDFTFQLDSWTLSNSDGIFQITDKQKYTLGLSSQGDGSIPSCNYLGLYKYGSKTINVALAGLYSEIDTEIKKKIASLTFAMKEDSDDGW